MSDSRPLPRKYAFFSFAAAAVFFWSAIDPFPPGGRGLACLVMFIYSTTSGIRILVEAAVNERS
jgi:hypothetical protein